jgi:hypothetical protein
MAVHRKSFTGGKSPRFMDCNFVMMADDDVENGMETKGFQEKVINEIA